MSVRFTDEYTPPVVRMITNDQGGHPEPALDQSWTRLEKLRWLAALVELGTGLRVRVGPANYCIGGVDQLGYFDVSVSHKCGGSSAGPKTYDGAWHYLSGIQIGAEAMQLNIEAGAS